MWQIPGGAAGGACGGRHQAGDGEMRAATWRPEALQAADDLWGGAVEPGSRAGGTRQQAVLLGRRGRCGGERRPE
jgi:hypothetical protein